MGDAHTLRAEEFMWAVGSVAQLHRLPFDAQILLRGISPPYSFDALLEPLTQLGLDVRVQRQLPKPKHWAKARMPAVVELAGGGLALVIKFDEGQAPPAKPSTSTDVNPGPAIWLYKPNAAAPERISLAELPAQLSGRWLDTKRSAELPPDPDAAAREPFGFRWFVPAMLKHKRIWRDVLVASLVLQLIALATPLFTQVIIDKVVVHHTTSTLIVIGVAMLVFTIFNAILGWIRQYMVLHTGNRIDAHLGTAVFQHLFRLPLRYFEHRPTGVISARLHAVETIREFVASSLVTLILDLPFLLIFVAVMLYYSVPLTAVVLVILGLIAVLSVLIGPAFQRRLNQQFLLGARNQAFATEYVAGMETVKSLQMEPQVVRRWRDYLASHLEAGFATRQLMNSYNITANSLEQAMNLLVLILGAWIVMHGSLGVSDTAAASPGERFTIGMLVAFQMFAGKLSQPVLRLVGLWQQFQQARLSVARLADIMDAPQEHYALLPQRPAQRQGHIAVQGLAFRYGPERPFLLKDLHFTLQPGTTTVLVGPSGSGKSTLTKLLLGFLTPSEGHIKIDGVDTRQMPVNELRAVFGVVPQETMLFSGTVLENLLMSNPLANFEQAVQACKHAEIHEVIEQLPQGYQTPIGERGAGLSGGQKQRLAIARALLKEPKVLIFDEATSALDAETDQHFCQTVNRLKANVAVLFVTHKTQGALQIDQEVRLGAVQRP